MRQYIGARYVPKYYEGTDGSTTWEQNVAYEPLTVVTYLSASYTSKKAVPPAVGNPADNHAYWVMTANFPGQIGDLTQKVETLDDKIDTEVGTLDAKIDTEVGTLDNKIDSEVATLEASIEELDNSVHSRKYIFIGDSYGMRHEVNWCQYAVSVLGGTKYAYSSYGFTPTGLTFMSILETAYSNAQNPDEITDIVICGGWNDARELETERASLQDLQNAILACGNYVASHFENAVLWIGFMAFQNKYRVQSGTSGLSLSRARKVYNGTNHAKIRHLRACQYPMLVPYLLDESRFHPSMDGGTELGLCVVGELQGHYDFNHYQRIQKSTLLNATDITSDFIMQTTFENGVMKLETNFFTYNASPEGGGTIVKLPDTAIPLNLVGSALFLTGYVEGTGISQGNTVTLEGVYPFYYTGTEIKIIYANSTTYFSSINASIKLDSVFNLESLEMALQ